ncbi:MAG: hypothetical protein WCC72_05035 [Dehalococcoidales bacterium]
MNRIQKTETIDLTRLKRGQIITRKYFEFFDRISLLVGSPKTDFIHYAVVAVSVENHDDWLTFNARVAGGLELLPISRFKGQTVRVYYVKDGDREAAYFEANRLMETGARFEGLFGWNYFFRILPSLISYWILLGPQRVPWNEAPNVDSPNRINCLVLIRKCYPNLIPADCYTSAFAFEQAYKDGNLILEQEGMIP